MEDMLSIVPLILCVGIFVQAAAGFGGGLLIVPALLWCGIHGSRCAVCALLVATVPQNLWGVWTLRDAIPIRKMYLPGIARIVFLPLGVWAVWSMESLPTETIRQIVGGFVLLATISIMLIRPTPRERIHPIWGILAFPLSGFLQGLVGMGGPPMVFWIQAHDWDNRQMRGFLFAMFLISILPAIGLLYLVFGDRIVRPGLISVGTVPLLLVATYFGMRMGAWLGRRRLRSVTLWLLILMGLSGLAAPWLSR